MTAAKLIAEARRQVGDIADKSSRERLIANLADALESAEDVMLAIAHATSGPGDGPSDMEMVAGVTDALTKVAVQRAREKWEDVTAERDSIRRLHEVATQRAAAIRIIASDWQLGQFSSRHFGAHQAMTQIVAALSGGSDE